MPWVVRSASGFPAFLADVVNPRPSGSLWQKIRHENVDQENQSRKFILRLLIAGNPVVYFAHTLGWGSVMRQFDGAPLSNSDTSRPDIPSLHGLRGLAALIVFVSHFSNITDLWGGLLGSGAGQFGVMIFFTLSGFLMGYLYVTSELNGRRLLRYATSRIARILPLYFSIVLFCYLANEFGFFSATYRVTSDTILQHIFLIQGDSVLWTIPVEMVFYLFVAAFWFLAQRSLFYFWPVLAALIGASYIWYDTISWLPSSVDLFLGSFEFFAAGLALGILQTKISLDSHTTWIDGAFVLLLLALPMALPQVSLIVFGYGYVGDEAWNAWPNAVYCAALVGFAARSQWANLILGCRVMRFFGNISYGLYLSHMIILMSFIYLASNIALYFLICLFLTILTAWLLFVIVEMPARKSIRAVFLNSSAHSIISTGNVGALAADDSVSVLANGARREPSHSPIRI